MFDQGNHLSFYPEYKMHSSYDGEGDVEFDFWGANESQYYRNFSDGVRSEIEFQAQLEDDFVGYSPILWQANMYSDVGDESAPLLTNNYNYSNFSPRSRLQVVAEGRRKIMEMVHSMPESSYELSLKDIVDEQHVSEGAQEEMATQNPSFDFKITEAPILKKQNRTKRKNIRKSGPISRSASMEKETFLIKMFIPTSLSFKMRDNTRKVSKVRTKSSLDGTDNRAEKQWWLKRILFAGEGKNRGSSSSSTSNRRSTSSCSDSSTSTRRSTSSCSDSSTSRQDTDIFPSCWPFFFTAKCKSASHKGHPACEKGMIL